MPRVIGTLNHTRWECKYHIVFIPKRRKKVLYGQLRPDLGQVFRELAERKECHVEEGHLMIDHVHMLISIPPKLAVAAAMGFIKDDIRERLLAEPWARARLGARLLGLQRVEVDAGAEAPAGAGQDHHPHRVVFAQRLEGVDDVLAHLGHVGVEPLWAVEGNGGDAVFDFEDDGLVGHQGV